ncbi:MAG: M48 family metalloprotease [Gemmatimonas sp.]
MTSLRSRTARPFPLLAAALAAALTVSGCETNPATGGRMLSLMSGDQEKQVGGEEHPKLVQEFGGEIQNAEVKRYVDSVGNLLVKTTETPDAQFTFSVLDSDIVNAFALPGGYVHITRGLMALVNTEAELAGVVGHEIGHVTARHSAQLYTRSIFANILAAGLGIATGSAELGQVAGQGAGLYIQSYSRDNEYEADSLGVRYMSRAGFDPQQMAEFLKSLEAQSRLEAQIQGLPPDSVDQFNIMATHPRTLDRVQRAISEAAEAKASHPENGRDVYLRKINGLIYGDSPDQGFVRGNRFAHPQLRFAFEVPNGFRLANQPASVLARNPSGAAISFSEIPQAQSMTPRNYLSRVNVQLGAIEDLNVNGMQAATGVARVQSNGTVRDLRVVVVRFSPQHLFRFMFLTAPQQTASLDDAFKRTVYSLKPLSASEAAALKPYRVQVLRVRSGDTVESLASRMPYSDLKVERFRVLNGLAEGATLTPGTLVKTIVEGDVQPVS